MEEYVVMFYEIKQINDFVHWAEEIPCHMDISYDSVIVDGKSILGITMLGLEKPLHLSIHGQLSKKDREYIKCFEKKTQTEAQKETKLT